MSNPVFNHSRPLLEELVACLNQLPRKAVRSPYFRDTYEMASAIDSFLNTTKEPVEPPCPIQ